VKQIIEKELGSRFDDVFEQFDEEPVGSASIAQVDSVVKIIEIVFSD
jgi:predicted unusual protein kinase regulating ubiquinone biosynthesis (AarF/ABC1/UbiB family)